MDNATIIISRDDLDNAVFSAAQECADRVEGLTVRAKMKWALETADTIMASVDIVSGAKPAPAKAVAPKPAPTRRTPTPGPAIPVAQMAHQQAAPPAPAPLPPVPQTVVQPIAQPPAAPQPQRQLQPGNFLNQPDTTAVPPPPHPALAPGNTPFGAPPQ